MTDPGREDALDRLLRADARMQAARPDPAFTTRVLAALPPARAARGPAWLAPLLVLGSAALGSLLAALLAPGDLALMQGFNDLFEKRGLTPATMTALAIGGALTVSGLVLAAGER